MSDHPGMQVGLGKSLFEGRDWHVFAGRVVHLAMDDAAFELDPQKRMQALRTMYNVRSTLNPLTGEGGPGSLPVIGVPKCSLSGVLVVFLFPAVRLRVLIPELGGIQDGLSSFLFRLVAAPLECPVLWNPPPRLDLPAAGRSDSTKPMVGIQTKRN